MSSVPPNYLPPHADPNRYAYQRSLISLAFAWVLVLVPLAAFAALAEDVAEGEVFQFDRPVMLWLHSRSSPALDVAMKALTELGGLIAVPIMALILAGVMWWRGRKRAATLVAAAVIGSALFNAVLKAMFRRSRPDFWQHLVVENSWSFPSGHAMASASLALACIAIAWQTRLQWPVVTLAGLYVVLVGISRMYLGVHYPSDVVGGWCAGAAWVAVVVALLSRTHSRRFSHRRYSTRVD